MKADVERAERAHEVRIAAREWRREGIVDAGVLQTILAAYPDDRYRVGPAFRVLLFVFTLVAVLSAFALAAFNEFPTSPLLVLSAVISIGLTEAQFGKLRRASSGAEEATALLSVLFVVGVVAHALDDGHHHLNWRLVALAAALAFALAGWRWGGWVFGALAAASLFLMLFGLPSSRLWWILLGAVLAPPLLHGSVSARLAPSHRRACDAALVTVLAALYLSVHLGSFDHGLLEGLWFLGYQHAPSGWPGRGFYIFATAALPVLVLVLGIVWRRPILLRVGLVLAVASVVTLRFYVHVAPLWVVLLVSGGLAIAIAIGLHRYLDSGRGRERYGFTAEPLLGGTGRSRAFELGMAAALGPAAAAREEGSGFRGGGGDFGGGGAGGKY